MTVRFPSAWLLQPHLNVEGLSVDFVARLFGTNRQSLQRKLRANGTTLSTEIHRLKKLRAIESLTRTNRPITDIAASLGFKNPTSFTRAFRSWTGESPREYRKTRQAP